ncbi:NFX1-type zinc finger-containing protein 1-like [Oopsacas minuta]|uniref:NFX1-type zinc finger-containing protein 1-like n=1 Tax=Oopsacas minuta TaxID=111878 RepID=A0AAV7KH23_9METZ|nr:NFX1-type zinc finger-containing protein 1-like [Oopsacas minuta]
MASRSRPSKRRGGRMQRRNFNNPLSRHPRFPFVSPGPPPIPTGDPTQRQVLSERATQSEETSYLREYLKTFLLPLTEEGYERILPRKILNTSKLFRKLLRLEYLCVNIFKETLAVLTCSALCDRDYKQSDAVIKVYEIIESNKRIQLETLIPLTLEQPIPETGSYIYFEEKKLLVLQISKLLASYTFEDKVKKKVLNLLVDNLNYEKTHNKLDAKYITDTLQIHKVILDNIRLTCANNSPVNTAKSLSQFITYMLPSLEELIGHVIPIKPKPLIIKGAYKDTKSFLKIHYDLLREDMVQPLRHAIKDYLTGDEKVRRLLFIYNEVKFLYPECEQNQGLMYRLQFNVSGVKDVNKIKWDRCERLKFGTLLCIVEEHDGRAEFRDILWAIVSDRNTRTLQNKMEICVKFPCGFEPRVNFSQTYIMLESREVYFESYCHTLSILHSMKEMPFTEVLLGKPLQIEHPKYLCDNTLFNLSSIFPDIDNPVFPCLGKWPDTSPKLDSSQYKALRLALTKEVSLIQGPPGTGKTYVGALTLEIMLQTKQAYHLTLRSHLFSDEEPEEEMEEIPPQNISIPSTVYQDNYMQALESPILIITYTNHALDQFLLLLLKFESKIVRIGSNIEQDELRPHSLNEIRRSLLPPRSREEPEEKIFLPKHMFELKKKRGQLMNQAWDIKEEMAQIAKKLTHNYVSFSDMRNICSEYQVKSIDKALKFRDETNDHVLIRWRRGSASYIQPTPAPTAPISQQWRQDETEYIHSASDDEDEVEGRYKEKEDISEFIEKKKRIAVWDNLHQVLSQYELNQLISNMPDTPKHLQDVTDLWILSGENREKLYNHWLDLKHKLLLLMVEERSEQYALLCDDVKKVNREIDLYILQEAAVVGMTTTGAARNSELIRQLNPRIIFVEEAAEVLEAHIIASLTKHVQHLILIGDHQQLRPSNADYTLAINANLNVSLFERLIKNKVEHVTLQHQHRMRPEISQLIRPIYPHLIDHDVVKGYEELYGVRENIFFIDHHIPEDNAEGANTSKTHKYEALYLATLANYLVNRGYGTDEITILTFYQGQKFCILDELRRIGIRLRVSTVDKYQGEENRVILFSVVRSNKRNIIGHCSIDNRVCVALSRAKEGLIMIGNARSLRAASRGTQSNLWNTVLDNFGPSRVSETFPLYCHRHPASSRDIHTPQELEKYKDGICKLPCEELLNCGHRCKLLCHYINHRKVKCKEFCERMNPECGHPCVKENGDGLKFCYERCGNCNYKVVKTLDKCNHKKLLACHLSPTHDLCVELCENKGICGHPCVKQDGRTRKSCADICGECNYPVLKTLPCTHQKTLPCHQLALAEYCTEPCTKTRSCDHPCKGYCNQDCETLFCDVGVMRNLTCTHDVELKCSYDFTRHKCHKPCLKRLKCDHPCPRKCYEECRRAICTAPCDLERMCGHPCVRKDQARKTCPEECGLCMFLVEKRIEGCGHRVKLRCSVEPIHSECNKPCKLILPCGHLCNLNCNEKCGQCEQTVIKNCYNGHLNEMKCSSDSDDFQCEQNCVFPLSCGHPCPLSCQEDCLDAICEKPCKVTLSCGHPCVDKSGNPRLCYQPCGDCYKLVTKKLDKCGHSMKLQCMQKPLHSLCEKLCNKTKACDHQCTGKCGEECSSVLCGKEVKRELKCKHVKKVICHIPLDQIKCEEKCRKKLSCGHPCLLKCFEDCSKSICQVNQTANLACRHTITLSCHEKVNKRIPPCSEPCEQILPCGHDCTGDCGDECSEIICQVKIDITLDCKHSFKFQCSNALKIFHKNKPDEVYHLLHCSIQNCGRCHSVKQSFECRKRCEKPLDCIHKCVDLCHESIMHNPCREFCPSRCVHAKCLFRCGDVCKRCEKPCEWRCVHMKCTNKCWERCNRPACNEWCPIKLECGHPCLGLCGERCPEICNICKPHDEVFNHTNGPLISLECGHYFPLSTIDQHFDKIGNSMIIPSCPKCPESIYTTHRYGETIKRIQRKVNLRKRTQARHALTYTQERLESLISSRIPNNPPVKRFIGLLSYIQDKLATYQLTKFFTITDLLGILAGIINHSSNAWGSIHHSKLLDSKILLNLIDTPTNQDDNRSIQHITSLSLRCELCSIASVIKSSSENLSEQEEDNVEKIYRLSFSAEKMEDRVINSYLKELNTIRSEYSIHNPYLFKFIFTRPPILSIIDEAKIDDTGITVQSRTYSNGKKGPSAPTIQERNQACVSSHDVNNTPKGDKKCLSRNPKRPGPSETTNQPKSKCRKIEFREPENEDRKVRIINRHKERRPSRGEKST